MRERERAQDKALWAKYQASGNMSTCSMLRLVLNCFVSSYIFLVRSWFFFFWRKNYICYYYYRYVLWSRKEWVCYPDWLTDCFPWASFILFLLSSLSLFSFSPELCSYLKLTCDPCRESIVLRARSSVRVNCCGTDRHGLELILSCVHSSS